MPQSFREDDLATLHALMRRYAFATLFTQTDAGPLATHIPLVLHEKDGRLGTLVGHVARANPHWRALDGRRESLVVFLGPHSYISPAWYAQPVAVPTWNYAAIHALGVPRITQDRAALRAHVDELVQRYEGDGVHGWDPASAEPVIEPQLGAIVGFEMEITRLEGKLKFNQNRSRADRAGVVAALEAAGDTAQRDVAEIMRRMLESEPDA